MNGAGECGALVDQAAVLRLSEAGAERCERLDSPNEKGGARRDCRDEQHAFKQNDEHGSCLRTSPGSRDSAYRLSDTIQTNQCVRKFRLASWDLLRTTTHPYVTKSAFRLDTRTLKSLQIEQIPTLRVRYYSEESIAIAEQVLRSVSASGSEEISVRSFHRTRVMPIAIALGALVACKDPLAPFQPELSNTTDSFALQATGVSGVSSTKSYTWTNTGTRATINHSTTTSAGSVQLTVRDAGGAVVYDRGLVPSLNEPTAVGVAGTWTVQLRMTGYSGTLNFRAQKL